MLKSVIDAVDAQQNAAKAAAAWVGEKAGRLKPNDQLTGYSSLSQMIEIEGLSLGIEGKRLLWLTLGQRRTRGWPRSTSARWPSRPSASARSSSPSAWLPRRAQTSSSRIRAHTCHDAWASVSPTRSPESTSRGAHRRSPTACTMLVLRAVGR